MLREQERKLNLVLLKDFSFLQIASEASLELGETVYTVDEDYASTMAYCSNPEQSSCSHYSQPGYSCNKPSQSSCSHYSPSGSACNVPSSKTCSRYTSIEEPKVIMTAA